MAPEPWKLIDSRATPWSVTSGGASWVGATSGSGGGSAWATVPRSVPAIRVRPNASAPVVAAAVRSGFIDILVSSQTMQHLPPRPSHAAVPAGTWRQTLLQLPARLPCKRLHVNRSGWGRDWGRIGARTSGECNDL